MFPRALASINRQCGNSPNAGCKACPRHRKSLLAPSQVLSTREEVGGAGGCLRPLGAHSLLLVTSDFHPRRALSSFHREFPDLKVSVAAVYDPTEFGLEWWTDREWAKNTVYEWMRLA